MKLRWRKWDLTFYN